MKSGFIVSLKFFLSFLTILMCYVLVLQVRLMGCQDLLEDVPGRSRRDKDNLSSPTDIRSFVKGVTGRSSSKSYSVKDETSREFLFHVILSAEGLYSTHNLINLYLPC